MNLGFASRRRSLATMKARTSLRLCPYMFFCDWQDALSVSCGLCCRRACPVGPIRAQNGQCVKNVHRWMFLFIFLCGHRRSKSVVDGIPYVYKIQCDNLLPTDCVIHPLIRVVAHMHHLIARVVGVCLISMFHVLCVVVCVLLLC